MNRTRQIPSMSRIAKCIAVGTTVSLALAQTTFGQESPSDSRRVLRELNGALQELSEQVAPAVVQVFTTGLTVGSAQGDSGEGTVTSGRLRGSGTFIDGEGHILTSARLVLGAERIGVLRIPADEGRRLEDRSLVRPPGQLLYAKLVGHDLETDLAVLKVETRVLRFLRFGDSDALRKGQLVFSFSNSQGYRDTMSMGVISSEARQVHPEDPVVYIETDASGATGNGGASLVNLDGELIGVESSHVRGTEINAGFSLAIPSNIARVVYQQILQHGRVRRGVIGATTQTITPMMAGPLGLPLERGVIVADVDPYAPADVAGLRRGDIIRSLDGKEMENARQFEVNVYQRQPGDTITLDVRRGGAHLTLRVTVTERSDVASRLAALVDPKENLISQLGILALETSGDLADFEPLFGIQEGILVAATADGVDLDYKFLPGDLIHSINGKPIKSLAELRGVLKPKRKGDIVVLQVARQGQVRYATVAIE